MTERATNFALYVAFCVQIRDLARTHRISVTRWWSSEKHNADVGGLVNSRHLDGIGCDVIPDPDEDRAEVIHSARQIGLQVVDEGTHIHLELDPY
jgi:hypothetical protein